MKFLAKTIYLFILLMPFVHNKLWATIQPDRPGFSTGAYTVEPNAYYIELGVHSSYENKNDSITAPLINFRTGINSTTEFNIFMDGWTFEKNNNTTNISNILIGIKHRLIKSKNYNISVLGYFSLPTSNSDNSTYFLGILWDYSLNKQIQAFGTLQAISLQEESQNYFNIQAAIGLSYSLTPKLSSYIEYYNDSSINSQKANINTINAGIAYLITTNIQLDAYLGTYNNNTNRYIGVGLAIQF